MSQEQDNMRQGKRRQDKPAPGKKKFLVVAAVLVLILAVGWWAIPLFTEPAPEKAQSPMPARVAQPRPAPEPEPEIQEDQSHLLPGPVTLRFRYRSYYVTGPHRTRIRAMLKELETPAGLVFHIDAYTCDKGKRSYNKWLSGKRALSIRRYLMKKGVPKSAITYTAHGESGPVSSNKSRKGRSTNRRAVITVTPVQ